MNGLQYSFLLGDIVRLQLKILASGHHKASMCATLSVHLKYELRLTEQSGINWRREKHGKCMCLIALARSFELMWTNFCLNVLITGDFDKGEKVATMNHRNHFTCVNNAAINLFQSSMLLFFRVGAFLTRFLFSAFETFDKKMRSSCDKWVKSVKYSDEFYDHLKPKKKKKENSIQFASKEMNIEKLLENRLAKWTKLR